MDIKAVTDETIKQAAEVIQSGGLVGMPTETVYGLSASAYDGGAVAKIYEAKGRPSFNPLISHVASIAQAQDLGVFDERAKALAEVFWPGPLTLILPRAEGCKVSELAMAGLETIAIRMPKHDAALRLIKESGVPLVAPSANKSGSLSPTTPMHVAESLGDGVDFILAAGACGVGLESTVLDLSGDVPYVLRPGAITAEDLAEVLGCEVVYDFEDKGNGDVKSPGQLLKHYAPDLPVRLNAIDLREGEALLAFGTDKFIALPDMPEDWKRNLSAESDLNEAASNLFSMLKELDKSGARAIAVMAIPKTGLGIAINDRLKRAAN